MLIEVKLLQLEKAQYPIELTEFGMLTEVNLLQ